MTLALRCPEVQLTLLDANPAQLQLVQQKVDALHTHGPGSVERLRLFGVGRDDPQSLSACGNFESLFRVLRALLDDLVLPAAERRALLEAGDGPALCQQLQQNRYWPVAFSMAFSDALLEAMFGTEATQHAAPGSYPAYFRGVVEQGLQRPDAGLNPWLHHVLLGHWLPQALPLYLTQPCHARFEMVHAPMAEAPPFGQFDLISLSNLFDWMDEQGVQAIVRRLCLECRVGSAVVLRQLNNRTPVEAAMAPAFRLETALSAELLARDRSLFYERLLVFVRT